MQRSVAPSRYNRPTRHGGRAQAHYAFTPTWQPSVIPASGRTICAAWSFRKNSFMVGVDVASVSLYDMASRIWRNYNGGVGWNGSSLDTATHKCACVVESADFGMLMSGSNGNGGIFRKGSDDIWILVDTTRWGYTNEGGSTNPRTAGGGFGLIDSSVRGFLCCARSGGRGIARTTDVAATFSDWAVSPSRNYTGIAKSPQWNCIYACADGIVAGQDGAFILTGLANASATITSIAGSGTANPGSLADLHAVEVVKVGANDVVHFLVGTTTNRGMWTATITHDPADAGFVAATHITWKKVFTTVHTSDRPQCMVLNQVTPGTSVPRAWLFNFDSNQNVTGSPTYVLTSDAGGTTENYKQSAFRCLDTTATTPTWTNFSGPSDSTMNQADAKTRPTPHPVMAFGGDSATEKSRWGGSSYQAQDAVLSPGGDQLMVVGKMSPWICKDPWGTPVFETFSHGLGALSGGFSLAITRDATGRLVLGDDDRGTYNYASHGPPSQPVWIGSDAQSGFTAAVGQNRTNSVAQSAQDPEVILFGHQSGQGVKLVAPFSYAGATISAVKNYPTILGATTGQNIGFHDFYDSASQLRYLGVLVSLGIALSPAGGANTDTIVQGFTSVADRSIFIPLPPYLFLCVPDKGVYRSINDGVTWTLWWPHTHSSTLSRFYGWIAQDPNNPTTIWGTMDGGGVWRVPSATTAASGDPPAGAQKVVGGSLPTGNEKMGGLVIDSVTSTVWCMQLPNATGETTHLHRLTRAQVTGSGSTVTGQWVEEVDNEITLGGNSPISLDAHHELVVINVGGQGALRRMR